MRAAAQGVRGGDMSNPPTRGEVIAWLLVVWISLLISMVLGGTVTDELRERLDRLASEPRCTCHAGVTP